MTKPSGRSEETLTLTLKGDRITADTFTEAVMAFLALVREVTAEVSGSATDVEWLVSVKGGSANVTFIGETSSPAVPVRQITETVYRGMKELSQRPAKERQVKRPRHFSDRAVKRVQKIAQLADQRKVGGIRVRRSRNHTGITRETARNATQILASRPTEIGSVEGRLEMMTVRGRPYFAVWDALHDREVRCYITLGDRALYELAYRAFRQRVSVFGVVRLTEAGEPISIQVKDIQVFPDATELPTAEDVYGILTKGKE